MSRPSSRQNPEGPSSPQRDGFMNEEQETLLRSSLSLTSLTTSSARPLSPIAIKTLLQEAYKKPSSPLARQGTVELGAWETATPRLPPSLQTTPPRPLQSSSSFKHQPTSSGSSFTRSPSMSQHAMHAYPNQHRAANAYRNFIIDDADPAFHSPSPSSPSLGSHSKRSPNGQQPNDGPGKRKPSLMASMSFTTAPPSAIGAIALSMSSSVLVSELLEARTVNRSLTLSSSSSNLLRMPRMMFP
jgi:hypothetical protein